MDETRLLNIDDISYTDVAVFIVVEKKLHLKHGGRLEGKVELDETGRGH